MLLQFFSAVDIAHYAMFGTNWLIATAAVLRCLLAFIERKIPQTVRVWF